LRAKIERHENQTSSAPEASRPRTAAPPATPAEILPGVLAGGDQAVVTERIADQLTDILEQPELVQRLAAMIRASATEPEMAGLLREFFPGQVLDAVEGLLGAGDPGLRINLFVSQLVGVVMGRAVVAIEPLASVPARTIADAVAPALTRYLIGPLTADER